MERLTDQEHRACVAIIGRQPVGSRALLMSDLQVAGVEALNADRSILRFHLPDYEREEGQMALCPEGAVVDADGVWLEVVVYIDRNSRLMEVEFIRYADGDMICPDWATFTVRSPSTEKTAS